MAYDRYDRDERSRWSDDRSGRNYRGGDDRRGDYRSQDNRGRDERGFWDRASDEVASWFGDDDAERRREHDRIRDERDDPGHDRGSREHSAFGRGWSGGSDREYDRGYGRDYDRDRASHAQNRDRSRPERDRDSNYDRGVYNRGGSSERDYNPGWRRDLWGARDWDDGRSNDREATRGHSGDERSYRPMAGDYGRGTDRDYDRAQTPYGRDEYRRTSFAGSRAGSRGDDRDFDPHYSNWRDRHMGDLDGDYDDYRREHQSKFENDFTSWREKRQQKRGLLSQIREHMDVVGSDDGHVGTVDKVAGDRIILTKSDPDSGGVHHSLSCSDVDRVEGDKVILDCKASEARDRWRDESRDRALFEREDQGEVGPRNLDRSFPGTYR